MRVGARAALARCVPLSGLRVLVAGAGFAGSILARALRRQGHEVALVDRARHPRFALGESATPLAAIALERLAARYDLPDLDALAAYGRWLATMPQVRRGLKRGFTFYAHRRGEPWSNDAANRRRLLVAASPQDAVADSHWLRADVDAWLLARARDEGVEVHEGMTLAGLARARGRWRADGKSASGERTFAADLVVDATGPGGLLAGELGLRPSLPRRMPATLLLGGHFRGMGDFAAAARARGVPLPPDPCPAPYPDARAAVHHLLAEGWFYALAFDHGVTSAGAVLRHDRVTARFRRLAASAPEGAWRELLAAYPSLAEQLAPATTEVGILHAGHLPRRWSRAAGEGWAMLPHAYCFLSPLFSTGIAWSLLGVERLALLLEPTPGRRSAATRLRAGLARYDALLRRESTHLAALLGGAYDLLARPGLFLPYTLLYFAAASFAEARQRLLPPPPAAGEWAWEGMLGTDDTVLRRALPRVRRLAADATRARTGGEATFAAAVRALIVPRDVAGLAAEGAGNLFAADLAPLRRGAHLLGLDAATLERLLPRLRLPS